MLPLALLRQSHMPCCTFDTCSSHARHGKTHNMHQWPQVVASVLQALTALVMDHGPNTATLVAFTSLAQHLGEMLEARTSPFDCDSDDSAAVLAAHCLIHVLGHMLCNNGQGSAGAAATPAGSASNGYDVVDGRMRVMVDREQRGARGPAIGGGQQAVYISLSAAARAVGVELPAVLPMLRKDSEGALSPLEAAELRCVCVCVSVFVCAYLQPATGSPF